MNAYIWVWKGCRYKIFYEIVKLTTFGNIILRIEYLILIFVQPLFEWMKSTMVSDHSLGFSSIKKCPTPGSVLYVTAACGSTLSRIYIGICRGETASESPQRSKTGTSNFRNAANHRGSKRALYWKKNRVRQNKCDPY